MRQQGGFTLIELIIVIVILGILAAVAIPRFVDLTEEAEQAAVQGVAGGLASASAINYATSLVAGADAVRNIDNCNQLGDLLVGGLADGYELDDGPLLGPPDGGECTVSLEDDGTVSATFFAIATSV